jgi:hypothetical protein
MEFQVFLMNFVSTKKSVGNVCLRVGIYCGLIPNILGSFFYSSALWAFYSATKNYLFTLKVSHSKIVLLHIKDFKNDNRIPFVMVCRIEEIVQ